MSPYTSYCVTISGKKKTAWTICIRGKDSKKDLHLKDTEMSVKGFSKSEPSGYCDNLELIFILAQ